MWVSMIKNKSEAFQAFVKFKNLAKAEKGMKIGCLRTDQGGEFSSSIFSKFCSEHGIKRQLSAPYSPQQNEVVERRNMTMMNMVRSMLKDKNLPHELWGEAVNTIVYILNRAPSRSLDGATPYEVWTGVKPNVEHFRVFGSLCHVKVLGEKLKKLQDRSKSMVFIGYEVGTKGYKCYDPETGIVFISRDVIFEEKSQWDWRNSNIEKNEGTFYSPNFFDKDEEQIDQEAPLDDYHEDVRSLNDIPDNGQGGHLIREERSPRKFADLDRIYEATEHVSIDPESCYLTQEEPSSYNEASKESFWRQAMEEELDSIEKNETWEMVTPPPGCKPLMVI